MAVSPRPERIPEWEASIAEHDVPPEPVPPPPPPEPLPADFDADDHYLGWPEDREKRAGPDGLTGHVKMTAVKLTDYEDYLSQKHRDRTSDEEIRGGFVYYTTTRIFFHAFGGGPGQADGALFIKERHKAPLPANGP